MQKYSGFTLVEMLVAVSVAVILLTVGVPSFQQLVQDNRRAAQVNDFVAAMTLARSEALKRGNNVGLCRTGSHHQAIPTCGNGSGWENGWIVYSDEDNDGDFDSDEPVLRRHPSLPGNLVTLRGNTNVQDSILYAGNGRIAGGTFGTLTWCDARGAGGDAREITFPLSGRVTVSAGDDSSDCGS